MRDPEAQPIAAAEVDAYVQAGSQLRDSAFVNEDHRPLGLTIVDGRVTKFELSDPNVRDSMLLSFRRIRSDGEPTH